MSSSPDAFYNGPDAYAQYLTETLWAAYDLEEFATEWEVRVYDDAHVGTTATQPHLFYLPAGEEDMRVPIDAIHEQVLGILLTLQVGHGAAA